MKIELRLATEQDIPVLDSLAEAIDAGQFMSRHLPDRLQKIQWEVIVVDGVEVGTVWAEANPRLPNVAFLGIFIGRSELLGKGVGRHVIQQIVTKLHDVSPDLAIRLNVRSNNTRAIACYARCGFIQIMTGKKIGIDGAPIPATTMQFSPSSACH